MINSISKDENVMINNFEAANKILNFGDENVLNQYNTFRKKLDLFFIDHEFIPLLVQENYLGSFHNRDSM
jgi:hypothetical protein